MQTDYSQAVQTFEAVRDMPFSIPTNGCPNNGCYTKSQRLVEAFDRLEIPSRMMVVDFLWNSLFNSIRRKDASLYRELSRLEKYPHSEEGIHVYVQAKTGSEYVNVDPTWDKALQRGFPVCEWDGTSNGQLAVPLYRYHDPTESRTILTDSAKLQEVMRDLEEHQEFYAALNDFAASLRSRN